MKSRQSRDPGRSRSSFNPRIGSQAEQSELLLLCPKHVSSNAKRVSSKAKQRNAKFQMGSNHARRSAGSPIPSSAKAQSVEVTRVGGPDDSPDSLGGPAWTCVEKLAKPIGTPEMCDDEASSGGPSTTGPDRLPESLGEPVVIDVGSRAGWTGAEAAAGGFSSP